MTDSLTSNVLAYAIRGTDNTTEVCLTETDALMKAIKLSKVFPTVTFSVVPLVEQPDEPSEQWKAGYKHGAWASAPPNAWQPIATAPKGGEWVLLWWPEITDAPFVGYLVYDEWRAATSGDKWPGQPGPTHWMPLPSPPVTKSAPPFAGIVQGPPSRERFENDDGSAGETSEHQCDNAKPCDVADAFDCRNARSGGCLCNCHEQP